MCQTCGNSNCIQCASTTMINNSCDGCQFTINEKCVVINGKRYQFEPTLIKDYSARTLDQILTNLESINLDKESKIITDSYTVISSDVNKILLLKCTFDDVSGGEKAMTITLPVDASFINKTITFKNISGVGVGGRTAGWYFETALQYQWSPSVLTSTSYNTLDDVHFNLKLTFVKIDSVNYQWIVVP